MTIASNDRRKPYAGNGVTTVFNGPRAFSASHIQVSLIDDATGVATEQTGGDYTLTGVGRAATVVTMGVAPPAGKTLLILRTVPYTQDTDIKNQGAFLPEIHEDAFDFQVMQTQQLADGVARSFRLPEHITGVNTELPVPQGLSPLVWNTDGDALENGSTTLTGDMLLRPNLADPGTGKGTDLLATQQIGAGAAVRTQREKNEDLFTAKDYGAAGDGTADDTASVGYAIQRAISLGKKSIRFPAGRYRLTAKVTATLPGIKGFAIEGEGMGITEFLVDYASGNGFEFVADPGNYWLDVDQHAAIRLANLSIVTNRVDVGTGVKIDGGSEAGRPPQACVFDHVEFRGATSFQHAFTTCVDLLDTASTQFIGCRFICGGPGYNTADGVVIRASASGTAPTEHKFTDCEWYFCDRAVHAGDYIEGVYFSNPTMVNCNKGIHYVTTTGESGLVVNGGHFNNYSRNIEVDNVFDVTITGPAMFHADNSASFRHISLKNCGAFSVQGHVIRGANTDAGIFVESVPSGWGGVIGPGYFRGVSAGVYLDSNSRNVTVAPQSYDSVTDRVVDAGTANKVQPAIFTYTAVLALAGGSPTEAFNIAIPSGMFGADALDAQCQINGAFNLGVHYDRDSGSNTPTNARFVAVPNAGGNVSGGNYRITATILGI